MVMVVNPVNKMYRPLEFFCRTVDGFQPYVGSVTVLLLTA